MPTQTELPFDIFECSRPLTTSEAAKRLACTRQHVTNLIDEGELAAINIGSKSAPRWRIPSEAWQDFGLRVSTIPFSNVRHPLRALPRASLIKLYYELKTHLKI